MKLYGGHLEQNLFGDGERKSCVGQGITVLFEAIKNDEDRALYH
jgi:hypothetical protein